MPSLKLHAVNALVTGAKSKSERDLTDLHHRVVKQPLLNGLSRAYRPRDDEGEQLPPELTYVQTKVEHEVLPAVVAALSRTMDLQFTQDTGNLEAKADVIVDGQVLLADVPVTYLLSLQKKLVDLRTFIAKLPTLDPAERWNWSADLGAYASEPAHTVRTKKVPRNHVLAEATDRHPAQVTIYQEDVQQGTWTLVKWCGAMPAAKIRELDDRVGKLIDAVRVAREHANSIDVPMREAGAPVFGYLFAGYTGT